MSNSNGGILGEFTIQDLGITGTGGCDDASSYGNSNSSMSISLSLYESGSGILVGGPFTSFYGWGGGSCAYPTGPGSAAGNCGQNTNLLTAYTYGQPPESGSWTCAGSPTMFSDQAGGYNLVSGTAYYVDITVEFHVAASFYDPVNFDTGQGVIAYASVGEVDLDNFGFTSNY